jgi:phosphoserine aminotransferase
MDQPNQKPNNIKFSSGPCAKRKNWNADFLNKTNLLGRSHRSEEVLAVINQVNQLTASILNLPTDYKIAITAASDTGAFECAMWNMIGERDVDIVFFEAFGKDWFDDAVDQLKIENVKKISADYGKIPDLSQINFDNDVVFTLNGTTSGVCLHDLSFIDDQRKGLTFCDATSAVFSIPIDFSKLDITTFSWQKSMGGEAQHGVLILSPRAVERIKNYTPNRAIPKIYQLKKKGVFQENIFSGSVINTTSTICILDALDALTWIDQEIGKDKIYQKVDDNFAIISNFLTTSKNYQNLCQNSDYQSKTSVCFSISHLWFQELAEKNQREIINQICDFLQENQIAYDIKGYKSAPPSFRVWCGITIEKSDLEILCHWFEYAFEQVISKINYEK